VRRAFLLLAVLAASSCALVRSPLPLRRICADGWPLKILQDPHCPNGICGYTCEPDRWREQIAQTPR
jgi:hypothetical protein